MIHLRCLSNHEVVELHQKIAEGGEGIIYRTSKIGFVAKIYHLIDEERVHKLQVMVRYPPCDPGLMRNHISIVWPKDLLEDDHGRCLGFLMPEIGKSITLDNVYYPNLREKNAPGFNWLYLHRTARNIASVLQALHAVNYVVGDIKYTNLLVSEEALVSIIDTDSFQITDPNTKKVYRCPVASLEYAPPEIFGKDLKTVNRFEIQDRFGLAVIIWQLLFGYHPFSGKWTEGENQPSIDELIRYGYWMYGANSKILPGRVAMPLNIIHPSLRHLFRQCFDDGYRDPQIRPSAADWVRALELAQRELVQCSVVEEHYYIRSYGKCYWCERKQQLGVDIFQSSNSDNTAHYIPSQPDPVPSPVPPPYVPVSVPLPAKVNKPKSRWIMASVMLLGLCGYSVWQAVYSIWQPSSRGRDERILSEQPPLTELPPQNDFIPTPSPTPTHTRIEIRCGNPMPSNRSIYPVDFYPVYIEYTEQNLKIAKDEFCEGAYKRPNRKLSTSHQAIQVASFTDREAAEELQDLLKEKFGHVEIGEPTRYMSPNEPLESSRASSTSSNPFEALSYPRERCGDSKPSDPDAYPVDFYPIYIDYSERNLEIAQNFCRDAYQMRRQGTSKQAIQIASMIGNERARQFRDFISKKVGSAEIGEPRRIDYKP